MNTNTQKADRPRITTAHLVRVAVLGAISAVLYYIPGIPVIPPIYKLDFSTIPALLAGFSMGPVYGLAVLLIKDLTGIAHSSSMMVGELADFLVSGAFVAAASLVYARRRTLRGALLGMGLGIACMAAMGALSNYYIMIPFYGAVFHMPVEQIVGMVAKTIPAVDSLWKLILLAVVPFNLLKGVAISLVTTVIYKRLSRLLRAGS